MKPLSILLDFEVVSNFCYYKLCHRDYHCIKVFGHSFDDLLRVDSQRLNRLKDITYAKLQYKLLIWSPERLHPFAPQSAVGTRPA